MVGILNIRTFMRSVSTASSASCCAFVITTDLSAAADKRCRHKLKFQKFPQMLINSIQHYTF